MSTELIKKLRAETGAGISDVKQALDEAGGDEARAIEILRKSGQKVAAKKADRATNEGLVEAAFAGDGQSAVLYAVACETDFVAKTEDFQNLGKEISMQIAAVSPVVVGIENISADELSKEKEILKAQALKEGKPEKIIDKIITGRLDKFYERICLLEQLYIRDTAGKKKVKELITDAVAKLGENISVKRFARFKIGEE